jgi:threonine/homoserine/homoserine lactone efflux protein
VNLLLAFIALELTLCLIPGPAVLLTVSYALRRGARSGLAAAGGIVAGNTVYFVLSGLGVAALLHASLEVFTVLRWAGALYLAFLGVRALLARRSPVLEEAPARAGRAFVAGLVTQISNPKAIAFFVAVVPQFVDPRAPLVPQLALLTLASCVVEFGVQAAYAFAAAQVRRSPAAGRASLWIERAGGVALLWIASRIVREPALLPQ